MNKAQSKIDIQIRNKVIKVLDKHRILNINTKVLKGIVTLEGTLENVNNLNKALAELQLIDDVNRIDNNIQAADPRTSRMDGKIASEVMSLIINDPDIDERNINCYCINGNVYVTGRVCTLYIKENVAAVVKHSSVDITKIHNLLRVIPKQYFTDDELNEELDLSLNRHGIKSRELSFNVFNGVAQLKNLNLNLRDFKEACMIVQNVHGITRLSFK